MTWAYIPYFIWGSNIFFLGTMIVQFSVSLGSYTRKRIFPVHMFTNNLQMANKLLHVFSQNKVLI